MQQLHPRFLLKELDNDYCTVQEKVATILDLLEEIKEELKKTNKHKYEQWKAGGFLVDDSIFSPNYPKLTEIGDYLTDEKAQEDENQYDEDENE